MVHRLWQTYDVAPATEQLEDKTLLAAFWQDDFENATTPELPSGGSNRAVANHNEGGHGGNATEGLIASNGDHSVRGTPGTAVSNPNVSNSPTSSNQAYTGFSGSFVWRAEDTDGISGSGSPLRLQWDNIDISGRSGLVFAGLFGARDRNNWDTGEFIRVQARFDSDAGAFTTIMQFTGGQTIGGNPARIGQTIGDDVGTELTLSMAEFQVGLGASGGESDVDIRFEFEVTGGSDEYAWDNLRIGDNNDAAIATGPEISVTGDGMDIPDGDNTPSTADDTDFGAREVTGEIVEHTFTINNTGGATLNLDGTPIVDITGTGASHFTVTDQPAATVTDGGMDTFTIRFDPSAIGTHTATVTIENDDADEDPFNFDITGEGLADTTVFWQDDFEGTSPEFPASGSNRNAKGHASSTDGQQGTGDHSVRDIPGTDAGKGFGQAFTDHSGSLVWRFEDMDGMGLSNPGEIEWTGIDITGISNLQFAGLFGARFGGFLEAGDFITVAANVDSGGYTTLLDFQHNGGNVEETVSGTDLILAMQEFTASISAGDDLDLRVRFFSDGGGDEIAFDNFRLRGAVPAVPEINVSGNGQSINDNDVTPDPADDTDFGQTQIGGETAVHTFTITNTGNAALDLTGSPLVDITGAGATHFSVSAQPSTDPVPASGGTTTFEITFDPSAIGTHTATVSIGNDDSDENPFNFDITGEGIADAPEIDVSGMGVSIADGDSTPGTTDDTDFGSVNVSGGTDSHTFTVTNSGFATLNLDNGGPQVVIGGAHASDFTVTSDAATTVSTNGGTTMFTIEFDPSSTGLRMATVTIQNDDADEDPYNFNIQGFGRDTPFWTDDFESTAPTEGDRDAPNHADGDNGTIFAAGDHFVRTNDASLGSTETFTNIQDSFYWAAENIAAGGSGTDPDLINWTGITITGRENLVFQGYFGGENNALFNGPDQIRVEADIDGGGFTEILRFESDGLGQLAQDTDFDGTGDGIKLTENLIPVTAAISGTGDTLSLRITVTAVDASEEIAFDHFTLEGRAVPTTTVSLSGVDLLIEDTDGGDTDDTLTISTDGTDIIITDPNNLLSTSIVGASGDGTNTINVPLATAGFTGGIIANTLGGDDQITIETARLTRDVSIDAGDPTASDFVTIKGTSGDDTMTATGSTVSNGSTTITLTNVEDGTIDLTAGAMDADVDAVTINDTFVGMGSDPEVKGDDTTDTLTIESTTADEQNQLTVNSSTVSITSAAHVSANLLTALGDTTVPQNTGSTSTGRQSIAVSPDGQHLYVIRDGNVLTTSAIHKYDINASTGALTNHSELVLTTAFANAGSITVSPDGKHIYLAGTGDNKIEIVNRNATTGALTLNTVFTASSNVSGNPSDIVISGDGRHVYAGTHLYQRDGSTGALSSPLPLPAGVSANGAAFSSDELFFYGSQTGTTAARVFSRNTETGALTQIQAISTATAGVSGHQLRAIYLSPDGRTAYQPSWTSPTSQNLNTLVVYRRDTTTGMLTHQQTITDVHSPWSVISSPNSQFVYTADSLDMVVFERDPATSSLTEKARLTGAVLVSNHGWYDVDTTPDSRFAYVTEWGTAGVIQAFEIDPGALTVTFSGLSELAAEPGSGNDTVTVQSFDTGGQTSLTLDGGADADAVIFSGTGVDTRNGSVTVTAEDVRISSSVAAGSGNTALSTDQISVDAAVSGTGSLTIAPLTATTSIGVGDATSGNLKLDSGEIGRLADGFSSITIGDPVSGTGAVSIDAVTFLDPVTIAGGTITDGSGVDVTAPAVTLDGDIEPDGDNNVGTMNVDGNLSISGGANVDFEFDGSGNDVIDADTGAETVDLTGSGNATFTDLGGAALVAGTTIILIDNDGADAITGEFANLTDGEVRTNFLNSGLAATVDYQGGDGNDLVLTLAMPTVSTVTLVAGALTVTDTSGVVNTYIITLINGGNDIRIQDTTTPLAAGAGATQVDPNTVTVPAASVTASITFNGSAAADSLEVDFTGGDPTGGLGLTWNGGDPAVMPGDSMSFSNGSFTTTTYTYDNLNDGNVNLDGTIFNYFGLEPITSTITAVNVILNYSTAAETITVTDAGGGSTTVDSTAGEITTFVNPTGTLTINAGDTGADTININGFGAGFGAVVAVNGGSGNDIFNVNSTPSSGDMTVDGGEGDDTHNVDLGDGVLSSTQLTTAANNDFSPNWHAGGSDLIAFIRDSGGLQIGGVNADGTGEGFLATGVDLGINSSAISWLGTTDTLLAAEAKVFHENMSFDTTQAPFNRVVSDGNDAAFTRELFIPGGRNSGAFVASRDGSTVAWRDVANNLAGGLTIRTATFASLTGQDTNAHGTIVLGPVNSFTPGARGLALTPDGSQLVVARSVSESDGIVGNDGIDLWLFNSNGIGAPTRLTSTGLTDELDNENPDISPDGTEIIFQRGMDGVPGSFDLFRMPLTGGTPVQLTNTPTVDEATPSWAPDGTQFAFSRSGDIFKAIVPAFTGGTVTITDTGVGGADQAIVQGGGEDDVFVLDANSVTRNGAGVDVAAGLEALSINSLGGDDSLIVDFDAGNLSTPVTFDGGAQTAGDTLTLQGGGVFADLTFGYINENDGTIDVTGNPTITYMGLEPITSTITANNVTLNYSTATETITVTDPGGGSTTVDSDAGEITTFVNPMVSLTINGGDTGDDTIDINGLAASYPASLTVNGGTGSDTININGAVSTNSTGVTVNADSVNTTTSLATGGGAISITADGVSLGASVSGSSTLMIQPQTGGTTIGLGGGVGALDLDDTELGFLQDGFSSITIGDATSGDVDIDTATFQDPVTLITGGEIHDLAGTDVTMTTPPDTLTLNGIVAPGQSPGILSVNGNFAFADNSSYELEIGGPAPGSTMNDHDQIDVTGTVTIGANVALNPSSFNAYVPQPGDRYVIINNDMADAISGTFNGLPEGHTFANFLGSGLEAVLTYMGGTNNNDVVINMQGFDLGDAPEPTYPTLLASDGARHILSPLFLGAAVDRDSDGFGDGTDANGDATDDDTEGGTPDDEDGVTFTPIGVVGGSSVTVTASTAGGLLNAWLDVAGDGFDPGDQIFADEPLAMGANTLTYSIPAGAVAGTTFARFRLDSVGGLSFTGQAADGEVEDYEVTITQPTVVYVDDSFATPVIGQDPDGAGPAMFFGFDAFATIQEGVDAVADTGTVNVNNGMYTEAVTIDDKGLTLTGESEAGVIVQATDTADAIANGPSGSNVFSIDPDNDNSMAGNDVLLEQLTIQNGTYGVRSRSGNVSVMNATVTHNGWNGQNLPDPNAPTAQADFVAFFAGPDTTNGGALRLEDGVGITVSDVTATENLRGIRVQDGDMASIHDNTSMTNIDSGIYLAFGAAGTSNSEVYNNTVDGNLNNGILVIGGTNNDIHDNIVQNNFNSGVMLYNPSEIVVRENTITNNNRYPFNGIGNVGDAEGGGVSVVDLTPVAGAFNARIVDNTIDGNQMGRIAQAEAIRIDFDNGAAVGFEIEGNIISNHDVSVHLLNQAAVTTVNGNSLTDTAGVENDDAVAVDASGNWWGSNVEATVAGQQTGLVDFTPFLDNGTDTDGGTVGFQGDVAILNVTALGEQTGPTSRIQEGIDLVADPGRVNILAGSYTGGGETSGKSVTLAPGGSPGLVTIDGDLTLDADDTLEIEIEGAAVGTGYDQVEITGAMRTVTLGGATLDASRLVTFVPSPGAEFVIISNVDATSGVAGTFAGLADGDQLTLGGVVFEIDYDGGTDGNDVVLSVVAPDPVYIDDNFANPVVGQDPDAGGPAMVFGYDSFATIQEGIDAVADNGNISIFAGTYADPVDVNRSGLTFEALEDGVDVSGTWTHTNSATLRIDSGATDTFEISGDMAGAGAVTKDGNGILLLSGTNAFGTLQISDGTVQASGGDALNDTSQVNLTFGTLELTDADETTGRVTGSANGVVDLNSFTLTSNVDLSSTWSGAFTGTGGVIKEGTETWTWDGMVANTHTGTTQVNDGTLLLGRTPDDGRSIPGDLVIGDGAGGNDSAAVRTTANGQTVGATDISIDSDGLLDIDGNLERIDRLFSLDPGASVDLGAAGAMFWVAGGDFDGDISGAGTLIKEMAFTLTLGGTSSYTGPTNITGGALIVDGSIASSSPVTVQTGATLFGDGAAGGDVDVESGGKLAPAFAPPTLNIGTLSTGNVDIMSGSTFDIEFGGTTPGSTATDHGQLVVTGSVTLGGTLNTAVRAPFVPAPGDGFVIIDNDGNADAVIGTFAGLPEGGTLPNFLGTSNSATISYMGGDGNDVEITVSGVFVSIDGMGNLVITDTGAEDDPVTIQADPTTMEFVISHATRVIGSMIAGVTGGAMTVRVPFADVTGGRIIANLNGGDDSLTVDYTLGGPFDKTIEFNGGETVEDGTGDELFIRGDNGTTVESGVYTPDATTTGDGVHVLTMTPAAGGGTETIEFYELEPTEVSAIPTYTLTTPGSDDDLTVASATAMGGQDALIVTGTSDGVAIESLTLFDVATFTIDTATNDLAGPGTGDDSITIAGGLDQGVANGIAQNLANFAIDTGATGTGNTDLVTVNAEIDVPGSVTIDNGETVDVDESITAGTSLTISNVGTEIDLAMGVDLTASNGDLDLNTAVTLIDLSSAMGTNELIARDTDMSGDGNVDVAPISDSGTPTGLVIDGDNTVTTASIDVVSTITVRFNQDADGAQGFSHTGDITTTDDTGSAVMIIGNKMMGGTGSAALGSITAGLTGGMAGGRVTVAVENGGSITDANGADNNITAGNAVLTADGGVASSGDVLETTVSRLEASGGAGGVFVLDSDSLTIGGISGQVGVMSAGVGAIDVQTTSGSLTVEEAVSAGGTGDIFLKANETAAGGDDLVVSSGVTIGSMSGSVSLEAGDDVTLSAMTHVNAPAGTITITGDCDDLDPGTGTTITIMAELDSTGTSVNGGGDDDTYDITYPDAPTTNSGTVTIVDTGGANDQVMIHGTAVADTLFLTTDEMPQVATSERVSRGDATSEPIILPSDIEALTLLGGDGNDIFNVQPSMLFPVTVDGQSPVFGDMGVPPGDQLNLDTFGNSFQIIGKTIFVANGMPDPYQGITFVSIENVPLTPASTGPDQRYDFEEEDQNVGTVQTGFTGMLPDVIFDPNAVTSFGWDRPMNSYHQPVNAGPVANLINDYHYLGLRNGAESPTFSATVDSGWVLVTVTYGNLQSPLEDMQIYNADDGSLLASGLSTNTGEFDHVSFLVLVDDGSLNLQFRDPDGNGGTQQRLISVAGIDIDTEEGGNPLGFLSMGFPPPAGTLDADGTTEDMFTISAAVPNSLVTVETTLGTIIGTDAEPDIDGFQVLVDGAGMGTFKIRRPAAAGQALVNLSSVTGRKTGCVLINYGQVDVWNFDFNDEAAATFDPFDPVMNTDGYIGVDIHDRFSDAVGYGWVGTDEMNNFASTATGANSDLFDGHRHSGPRTFRRTLDNGTYQVSVIHGDRVDHESNSIVANGTTVVDATSLNRNQYTESIFNVVVTTGQLDLTFSQNDGPFGSVHWIVNALSIRPLTAITSFTGVSGPGDVEADSLDPAVTVTAMTTAADGTLITVSSTLGTITTADADPDLAGIQVAVAGGMITFDIVPPDISGTPTIEMHSANGEFRSTVTDAAVLNFVVPVERRFDFGSGGDSVTQMGFTNVSPDKTASTTTGFGFGSFNTKSYSVAGDVPGVVNDDLFRDGIRLENLGESLPTLPARLTTIVFDLDVKPATDYELRFYLGRQDLPVNGVEITVEGAVTKAVADIPAGTYSSVSFLDALGEAGSDANGDGFLTITLVDTNGPRSLGLVGLDIAEAAAGLPVALAQLAVVETVNTPASALSEERANTEDSRENGGTEASSPSQLPSSPAILTRDALDPILTTAINAWTATGLTDSQLRALETVTIEITDLSGYGDATATPLALAGSKHILLDDDGAGAGWSTHRTEVATNQYDLLSVITHELGHLLGLPDLPALDKTGAPEIMSGTLNPGERHTAHNQTDNFFQEALSDTLPFE